MIIVEIAGPSPPPVFTATPDVIRGMATWLVSQCLPNLGYGGFVTMGIGNLLHYFLNPFVNVFAYGALRMSSPYLTCQGTIH